MVYEKDRKIIEEIYKSPKTVKKSAIAIHQKAREQGHKILLADVKKIIEEMPESQIYKKTKATTKNKQIYPIVTENPREMYQIDIMYMTETPDRRFNYIMNIIDVFSKFVYSFPLVNRTAESTAKRLREVFEKDGVPKSVSTDQGSEFFGEFEDLLREYNVIHKLGRAYNSTAQSIVERFNGTLRMALRGVKKWAEVLPEIIEGYNSEKHGTTHEKPIDVHYDKANGEHIQKARENIKKRAERLIAKTKSRINFKPGDKVRIILFDRKKALTKKSAAQVWSDEIHTVDRVIERENGEYVKLEGSNRLYTKNQLFKVG